MDLPIVDIEITTVDLPFREIPARHMIREIPHWTIFEVCKVTLHGGVVGWGESMQFYTWGRTTDEDQPGQHHRPKTIVPHSCHLANGERWVVHGRMRTRSDIRTERDRDPRACTPDSGRSSCRADRSDEVDALGGPAPQSCP